MFRKISGLLVALSLLVISGISHASSFSFQGNFLTGSDVQLFSFTTFGTPASGITIKTFGFVGGTQFDTSIILSGGFDPTLTLFDPNTNPLGERRLVADGIGDEMLGPTTLNTGFYWIALTQKGNTFASTLAGGPTITNTTLSGVSGAWAVDILNVVSASQVAVIPLPAALPLFLTGLAGLALIRRRQQRA